MSRGFNDVVCIDHFFPDNQDVLHFMDAQTRYSTGLLVPSTSMHDAIPAFETLWLSEFWPPNGVQGDKAFDNSEFKDYLSLYDVNFRPVPPRRHSKNVLESKHRILRDIYLRLKSASPSEDPRLLVAKMFRISNDLYGNSVASTHELAKGFTRPINQDAPRLLPSDIRKAHEEMVAKRKLNLILSSKSIADTPIKVGDTVQIYIRLPNQKRGIWSEPQPVLQYDPESQTVTIAGSRGRCRQAAVEDTRLAICENELAVEIQKAIDRLSDEVDDALDSLLRDSMETDTDQDSPHVSYADDLPLYNPDENELAALTHVPAVPSTLDPGLEMQETPGVQQPAPIIDSNATQSQSSRWSQPPAPSVHPMQTRSSQPQTSNGDAVQGSEIELLPGTELTSTEQNVLEQYKSRFQYKEFLLHHAQGLPSFITENA